MKKLFSAVFAIALVALLSAGAFAGEGCGSDKASTSSTSASVQTAAARTDQPQMSMEEMAKMCGMSVEECKAKCGGDMTNCGMTQISIKGMTCTGCEQTVTQALSGVEGVRHVVKVDHTQGLAYVCIDKGKASEENLTKAIVAKGYQAEIIPAVARSTDDKAATLNAGSTTAPKGCAPGCTKTCTGGKVKSDDKGGGSK